MIHRGVIITETQFCHSTAKKAVELMNQTSQRPIVVQCSCIFAFELKRLRPINAVKIDKRLFTGKLRFTIESIRARP